MPFRLTVMIGKVTIIKRQEGIPTFEEAMDIADTAVEKSDLNGNVRILLSDECRGRKTPKHYDCPLVKKGVCQDNHHRPNESCEGDQFLTCCGYLIAIKKGLIVLEQEG